MKKSWVVRFSVLAFLFGFLAGMAITLVVSGPRQYIVQLRPYHDEAKPTELSVDIDILDADRREQFFNGTFHWRQKDKPFTIVGREESFFRGYDQFGFELHVPSPDAQKISRFKIE